MKETSDLPVEIRKMKSLNTSDAIRYLQALITMPSEFDSRTRDLGWCCSEHALVLSLALSDCGITCNVAEGAVGIQLKDFYERVDPHLFVLSTAVPHRIYDSSILFKEVRGVFPEGIPQPVKAHLLQSGATLKNLKRGIWYSKNEVYAPQDFVSKTSTTPYGNWLTSISIDHPQFWIKAAETTSAILQGRITPPALLPNKINLVEDTLQGICIFKWK